MSNEVERIDAGSPEARAERLVERDAPAVVAGAAGEEARRGWSPGALRFAAGGREVSVSRSDAPAFGFDEDGEPLYSDLRLTLAEALELIAGARPEGPFYHIRRAPLAALGLPAEGLPGAPLARGDASKAHTLWAASAGCVTPLHYDSECNILTQLYGAKEVTLFPPAEHRLMYPYPLSGASLARRTFLYSRVDPEAFDEGRFPGFPAARRITLELDPGDALYLPPFWWHRVRSPGLSVAANLFWWLRPRQSLVASSADYLRLKYLKDTFADFFRGAAEAERPRGFARLAADARSRGFGLAAALFAGACVRLTLGALSAARLASPPPRGADVAALAHALAGSAVLDASEAGDVLRWAFLADSAAQTGRSPLAPEVEAMVSGASAFASRHLAWTGAPACAPIEA